ncbi:hypothetical protein NPIL_190491 [Nephila pilipes]|uniref:Uncharacterized protein n=1 Tax=Nephila pilipes TaxID=299642 RepID=A0A8X6T5U3_NEPPI|nr:hypothetical protein NPIL_190491 [Nephila pilipes]
MLSTYEKLICELESSRKNAMDMFFSKYESDDCETDQEIIDFRSLKIASKAKGEVIETVKIKSFRKHSKGKKTPPLWHLDWTESLAFVCNKDDLTRLV